MSYRIDGIQSEEELRRAQAAAQASGSEIPNYSEWSEVLDDLEIAGVSSTGSYSGDKRLLQEIENKIERFLEEAQESERAEEVRNQAQEEKDMSESDNEQEIKANLANATSSMIMADYMKYYHLMS